MKSLREQAEAMGALIGDTNGHFALKGYLEGARAALEQARGKACNYDLDAYHPFRAVDVDDIDALIQSLEEKP